MSRAVPTTAIREAVSGHETMVLDALGIDWRKGRPHIDCPYVDHGGAADWRWDARAAKARCTCSTADSIFDVIMKVEAVDFETAKLRAAELIGRTDLIRNGNGQHYQATDAASLLNAPADRRDDRLPVAYLAHRLGVAVEDVPIPSTPMVGLRALGYYDPPPPGSRAKPKLVGEFACCVFGTISSDGRTHAHRIYVAEGGAGKACLGNGADDRPRDPKKSAKIIDDDNTSGRSVLWGNANPASHIVVAEGIETGAAIALALAADIEAGETAVASAITAGGVEAFQPFPATRRVTIAADRDEAPKPNGKPGSRRGEQAAREFGQRHYEALEVAIALPGLPGESVDWLDVLRRDGVDAVRAGILAARPFAQAPAGSRRGNGASAPARSQPAIEVSDSCSEEDPGVSPIPSLCEAFWIARPVLTAIRKFAHSRACSGDAALGYLLARTAAFMPHRVRIDSGILSPTPPNLFALLIGTAGAGKSSTHDVFRKVLVPANMDAADDCPLGSGEGLAEAFMGAVEVPGGTDKKPATERRQVRNNGFFIADEGAVIKKLTSREGATLGESLRGAFTGAILGQSNASKETTRKIENYNLGLVANFTPGAAGAVLDDAEAGTPQRFLWFAATDPCIPERAAYVSPPWINTVPSAPVIELCPSLREMVRAHRVAVARGRTVIADLDGHKQLILLRVAAILAVWDERAIVREDDWDLASEIWKTSCGVRDWIVAQRRRIEEEAEADKTRRAAVRSVVVSHAVKTGGERITTLARRVALKVHGARRVTEREIRNLVLTGDERQLLTSIMQTAEACGWVVADGDRAWSAGSSKPA